MRTPFPPTILLLTLGLLACPALLLAQDAASATSAATTATASAPASSPATSTAPADLDPKAAAILENLEAAGKNQTTLTADLEYTLLELLFNDVETRKGQVTYRKENGNLPTAFRIHFASVKQGADGVTAPDDVDYVFDGRWFIIRKARLRQIIKSPVAVQPGQKVEPLKLGKGPFPVPFGQEKAEVLRLYNASTREARPGDLPNTSYLKLIPKDKTDEALDVSSLEMWVNKDGLPEKIISVDADKQKVTTVFFRNIKPKATLARDVFEVPMPRDVDNWDIRIEPLPKQGVMAP